MKDKKGKKVNKKDRRSTNDKAYWIDADQNPFEMNILYCRDHISSISDLDIEKPKVAQFLQNRAYDIDKLTNIPEDQLIQNYTVYNTDLVYPLVSYDRGYLYKAKNLKYKWDIYLSDDILFFIKSWPGELVYAVPFSFLKDKIIIKRIYVNPKISEMKTDYVTQSVDFLIKVYLYAIMVPHPIDQTLDKENIDAIVESALTNWGHSGWFATYDDTTNLDIEAYAKQNGERLVQTFKKLD